MTDSQLIEKIAETLFKEEEIDAWSIFDNLEALFIDERPTFRDKYLEWQKNEELRAKEQEVMELEIRLAKAQQELEHIEVTGSAGGGNYSVKITLNGKGIAKKCEVDQTLMDDKSMLEDLIVAAFNNAKNTCETTLKFIIISVLTSNFSIIV